jgi:hypothetical protein
MRSENKVLLAFRRVGVARLGGSQNAGASRAHWLGRALGFRSQFLTAHRAHEIGPRGRITTREHVIQKKNWASFYLFRWTAHTDLALSPRLDPTIWPFFSHINYLAWPFPSLKSQAKKYYSLIYFF